MSYAIGPGFSLGCTLFLEKVDNLYLVVTLKTQAEKLLN